MKFIMMIGVPGSGKSTYCQNYLKQFPHAVWLSSDAMRLKLFGTEEYQKDNAKVFQALEEEALATLKSGKDVLYDCTNLIKANRDKICQQVRKIPDVDIEAVVFKLPLWVCLKRNKERERMVPEKVIRRMHCSAEWPKVDEGFQKARWFYR